MIKEALGKSGLAVAFLTVFFSTILAQDIRVKSPGDHNDIQPAIQAAVDKAENGDQIILPEGEFIINKSVVINKFISIKGQGLKKTILYRPEEIPDSILRKPEWENMFFYNIDSEASSGIVISDICFRTKKPSVVSGDGGSRAKGVGVRMNQCVDFVIERCRFEYFGNAGVYIRHKDTLARGVIRKNEFYYNAGSGLGYGVVIYGTNKQWVPDPKFGTANFIFVEDNIFDFHRHSIAAGGAALYVFRYNTVLNNIAASGGHAIDTHEAREKPFGTRAVEVYNNILINTTYTDSTPIINGTEKSASGASLENSGIAIRNGDAVVFNNKVKGYRYATTMSNWYSRGTVQPYPTLYSPGYLSGKALGPEHSGITTAAGEGDAFFWNNTNDPYGKGVQDSTAIFLNAEPTWWKQDRDFHFVPKPGYKPYTYPYPVKKRKRRR